MSSETRDMLLYGQLQEGLCLQLMRAPAVSGAKNYKELIVASRNEEKRLADFKRRQEYAHSIPQASHQTPRQKDSPDGHQQAHNNSLPYVGERVSSGDEHGTYQPYLTRLSRYLLRTAARPPDRLV